jgi:hypothetical protein
MHKIKKALQVALLALLIGAVLTLGAWVSLQRGCPVHEVNCVYVIQK